MATTQQQRSNGTTSKALRSNQSCTQEEISVWNYMSTWEAHGVVISQFFTQKLITKVPVSMANFLPRRYGSFGYVLTLFKNILV